MNHSYMLLSELAVVKDGIYERRNIHSLFLHRCLEWNVYQKIPTITITATHNLLPALPVDKATATEDILEDHPQGLSSKRTNTI